MKTRVPELVQYELFILFYYQPALYNPYTRICILEMGEADQPCAMLSDRTNFDRSPKITSISILLAQRIRETMLHSVNQPQNVTGCVGMRGSALNHFHF